MAGTVVASIPRSRVYRASVRGNTSSHLARLPLNTWLPTGPVLDALFSLSHGALPSLPVKGGHLVPMHESPKGMASRE